MKKQFVIGGPILLLAMLLTFTGIDLQAQTSEKVNKLFDEANQQYKNANYGQTVEACNEILAINPNLVGVHILLANVAEKKGEHETELKHLFRALKLNSHPYIKWRLAEVYLKIGNYSEALNYYNIYSKYKYITEKRRMELACKRASCIFNIQSIKKNIGSNEPINPSETYWPEISPNGRKLVFVKEGANGGSFQQPDSYISSFDTLNGGLFEPVDDSLFTKAGEENLAGHQKIIFFTGYDREDGFGGADIYFSHFVNGKWSDPINAGEMLNTADSESQPFFAPDSEYLYFTSNRKGGAGGNDIWRAKLIGYKNGGLPKWSAPVGLSAINSAGNEISPFYYPKKKQLYFASDTHLGMGGYDVFVAGIDNSGIVGEVENLGAPINTGDDEIGALISPISDTAFFSLARVKGEGLEIFSYNFIRGLKSGPLFYIYFELFNSNTNEPVQAEIEIVDETYNPAKKQLERVDENGKLLLGLKANRKFTFNVSAKNYMVYSQTVLLGQPNSVSENFEMKIALTPIEVGSVVDLYNIYFETNSFAILPNSESELDRVVKFLNSNKKLIVEIQGHTDSSGNAANNLSLSEQRAKAVVDYLAEKGIAGTRLKYKGYGDTQPIASNNTEEGRQRNRRTTIKIIEK